MNTAISAIIRTAQSYSDGIPQWCDRRIGVAKTSGKKKETIKVRRFVFGEPRNAMANPTGMNWAVISIKFIRPSIDSEPRLENRKKLPSFEALCMGGEKLKNRRSKPITATRNHAIGAR